MENKNYWLERKQQIVWEPDENADSKPKRGRPKNLKSPQELWEHACDYFHQSDLNPVMVKDFIRGGEKAGQIIDLPKSRPYTWAGLEAYLFENDIVDRIDDYKYNNDNRYSEFKGVIHAIDKIMYSHKFDGAATGIFNPSIIARDLGLAEKTEVKVEEQPLFSIDDDDETD